jgi:hypothetical protein
MRLGELLHRGAEHPNGADADAGRDRRRQRLPPGHASTGRHCSRIRALGSRLDAHAPIQSARLISYITQI